MLYITLRIIGCCLNTGAGPLACLGFGVLFGVLAKHVWICLDLFGFVWICLVFVLDLKHCHCWV
jgi:hypothetical protein